VVEDMMGSWGKKILAFVLSFTILAGCSGKLEGAIDREIEEFKMTDQNKKEVSSSDLKGKVWISNFMFTSCDTVCPPMTANMATLQQKIKDEGLDVELISFSVDPEVDTPEMLKAYVEQYNADQSTWRLLSGYSQEYISNFSLKNFKTPADKPKKGNQVIHGVKFYLMDKEGKLQKEYDGLQNTPYDEIISDIKKII
jgi:protein SCO1